MWGKRRSHSYIMHRIYAFLLMPKLPTQSSRQDFLKICFPKDKRVHGGRGWWGAERKNYDLVYQNLIKKYEVDLEH